MKFIAIVFLAGTLVACIDLAGPGPVDHGTECDIPADSVSYGELGGTIDTTKVCP